MKKYLPILFACFTLILSAQPGLYRHFPQTQAFYYFNCEMSEPVKTQDKGYIYNFFPWSPNLHGMGPADVYTIKTDSNFVPQWKKPCRANAIPLPTGGIILVYNLGVTYANYSGMHIEKITASGVQVWIKNMSVSEASSLNHGVCYYNKVRFVGRKAGHTGYPFYAPTSQAYTLEMDTNGTFISQSLFNTSYSGYADFSKIKRDNQGNFFVYSNSDPTSASNMSMAKFDSNFVFVWGKTWSGVNDRLFITDIDILSNGRIFATGLIRGNYPYYSYAPMGALLKFDSQGNLLAHNYFDKKYKISGLCKKPNGNYIVSIAKGFQDSLFMFETDTSMNISWFKLCGQGTGIGTSVIKNNNLYTPIFYGSDPVMISNDLSGNSCASHTVPYSALTSSVGLTGFTFTPTTSSAVVNSGTINVIESQTYVDSCKCTVLIPVNQSTLCVGNTGTISIVGTGNLSWYSTPSGNSFIQSGSQFVYSSNTPTSLTVYAQDSACVSNPNRTAINIVVHAIPTLTFSPLNPTICAGSQVFVFANGATNYTWSNNSQNSYVQNLNPATTTNYTVTGFVAPGCSDTKTMTVVVIPIPTVVVSSSSPVCTGSTATVSVSGASTYTWHSLGGLTISSFTINPTTPGPIIYNVTGSDGFCSAYKQATVVVLAKPNISVSGVTAICSGGSSTFSASGANTYTWNTLSNSSTISVTPATSTIYTVSGSSLNTCMSSQSITLTVYPTPTLVASSSASSVCQGFQVTCSVSGASSYTWSNGQNLASFTVSAPLGNSLYTVTGANGVCTRTASIHIVGFSTPTITFISNLPVFCEGKTNTISALGASSYTWDNFSTSSSLAITPVVDTAFTVYGGNGGCIQSNTFNIQVYSNPTLALSVSDQSICLGESVTMLASGAQNYTWNTGANVNIIYVSPTVNTTYNVSGGNIHGCKDTNTIEITVNPLPLLQLSSTNSDICVGEVSIINASGASSYSWNSVPGGASVAVSPLAHMVYSVEAIDLNGCRAYDNITINVYSCTGLASLSGNEQGIIAYPNPTNGDLTVSIRISDKYAYFSLYNATGQLVLAEKITTEKAVLELKDLASGVYYLKIQQNSEPETIKILKE